MSLTGAGGMTAYLESTNGTPTNVTICFALFSVAGPSLTQIGSTQSAGVTASAAVPNPVTFNFNVGGGVSLAATQSIEVVVWLAATSSGASSNVSLVYDQSGVASQVSLVTT
ncbi:MAG TPA: hypothetical protein VMP89_12415 [Solirubrobacteraceae bacterium]|nr:hypothetical protein [Solirubrobacteraceae bacterium]